MSTTKKKAQRGTKKKSCMTGGYSMKERIEILRNLPARILHEKRMSKK